MILVPDIVYSPRQQLNAALEGLPDERREEIESLVKPRGAVSRLAGLNGLFVRFHQIRVLDNHASVLGLDVGADVYPIIMVVSDATNDPVMFGEGSRVFNDINDLDTLPIGNGLDVARTLAGKLPRFLQIHMLLMRSRQRTRDISGAIHSALSSDTGKGLQSTINTAVNAANPVAGVIASAASSILALVTDALSQAKDIQIFYGVTCFEDNPDELGIGQRRQLTDSKNASVIYEVVGQR
jgi:hypothetical protein